MITIKKFIQSLVIIIGIALIGLGIFLYARADYNRIYPSEFRNFIVQWRQYLSAACSEFIGAILIFVAINYLNK